MCGLLEGLGLLDDGVGGVVREMGGRGILEVCMKHENKIRGELRASC